MQVRANIAKNRVEITFVLVPRYESKARMDQAARTLGPSWDACRAYIDEIDIKNNFSRQPDTGPSWRRVRSELQIVGTEAIIRVVRGSIRSLSPA